jgi:hypothetical protein
VSKLIFAPFSVLGGVLAGILGRKLFERVWRVIDEEEAPDPKHREVAWPKLALALLLEGAIFRAVRGLFDHGSRRAFRTLTGTWPGKERPEPT